MSSSAAAETYASETTDELARAVLVHGPITRGALAAMLGLSSPTLTRLSKPLITGGILRELPDENPGSMGRPTKPLVIRAEAGFVIGIKLTGQSAVAVLTDLTATTLSEMSVDLPETSPEKVIEVIASLCQSLTRQLARGQRVSSVGISVGGFVERGVVVRAQYLGWKDFNLAEQAQAVLGLPVFVENDVVALTAAEHWFGSARGKTDFAVITVGAGVGYGLVRRDRVVASHDSRLGLGGHIPLDHDGAVCEDGHRGCSSAILTISGLTSQYAQLTGKTVSFSELQELTSQGNLDAARVVNDAATALGKFVALVANLAMVTTIVLAGEGLSVFRQRKQQIADVIKSYRDPSALPVELIIDDGDFVEWARGAAAIAIQLSLAHVVAKALD